MRGLAIWLTMADGLLDHGHRYFERPYASYKRSVMTVCAVVKLKEAIVAIADGRLTSGSGTSFNTTEKIVPVRALYQVPRISLANFSHFDDCVGSTWYVAYAGTYALCSQIVEDFRSRMISFYLVRNYETRRGDLGAPYLTPEWKRADMWDDHYNFRADELPKFDRSIVRAAFIDSCQPKADEWLLNRKSLDCEFLLFGRDDSAECYSAFKISVRENAALQQAHVHVEEAKQDQPVAIGEPQAVSTIVTDATLAALIHSSVCRDEPADHLAAALQSMEPSRTTEVEERFIELVRNVRSQFIGGKLTIATARSGAKFKLYNPQFGQ